MIFTIFQWLWLILLVIAAITIPLRPVMLKMAGETPLTERKKGWLWFLQSLGFWALVIGAWMKLETELPDLLAGEEEEG